MNKIEGGSISAIYYPSVKEGLSFDNIAIKPSIFDKKFSLTEVKKAVVVSTPTKLARGYSLEGIALCKSFDYTTDKILWSENDLTQPKSKIEEFKEKFEVQLM